jgi:hypothetical protein
MGSGAANMAALARQTAKIPDDSVAALVRWFIPRSEQVGGRMRWFGRNVKLSSKIRRRRPTASANTTIIVGTPASCWSIKSYGRRGGYDVQARRAPSLAISSFAPGVFYDKVRIERATKGDRRWDRLVAEADRKFPDVVAELLDRAVIV